LSVSWWGGGSGTPPPLISFPGCGAPGAAPSATIFLDDIGRNLKAARALGMTTIKVEDAETALSELEALVGVPLSA
jgi:hypothetical protein